jgi:hypothetical protein
MLASVRSKWISFSYPEVTVWCIYFWNEKLSARVIYSRVESIKTLTAEKLLEQFEPGSVCAVEKCRYSVDEFTRDLNCRNKLYSGSGV